MTESITSCYVCGTPSSTRCSQCKEAVFCSRECQKLVYPSHKYICSIPDKSTFYFPPLTRAEAEFMKKYLRNIEVTGRLGLMNPAWDGRLFPDYINFTTLYDGSFDEIIDAVTVDSPTLVPDPQLTALAILARFHLYDSKRIGLPYTPKNETEKLLGTFSLGASDLISVMHLEQEPFDENPEALKRQLQKLNEYFRTLHYYSAMLRQTMGTPEEVRGPMVVPSLRRLLAVEIKSFEPMVEDFAKNLNMTAISYYGDWL